MTKLIKNCLNKSILKPTGHHAVGVSSIDLYDSSRPCPSHPEGRLIPIRIYFPMDTTEHKNYPLVHEKRATHIWDTVQYNVYSQFDSFKKISKGKWPLIFMNHGLNASSTDYSWISEELASHGTIVISILHQLETDTPHDSQSYKKDFSINFHAHFVENILYTHKWCLTEANIDLRQQIDSKRLCLVGHSFGSNAILLLQSRTIATNINRTMLPLYDHPAKQVKECAVLMDSNPAFSFPNHCQTPMLFAISEERQPRFIESGLSNQIINAGHSIKFYKNAKHISFLDHGYVEPLVPNAAFSYFSGTETQRKEFFKTIRNDMVNFIKNTLK